METTDRDDDRLKKIKSNGQQEAYLVLTAEERAKGFVRPVRATYVHTKCGAATTMSRGIAESYARNPKFYTGTMCVGCGTHLPVAEFTWDDDGSQLGS